MNGNKTVQYLEIDRFREDLLCAPKHTRAWFSLFSAAIAPLRFLFAVVWLRLCCATLPILLTFCLFPAIPANAAGLTLTTNAKTRYQIVVATDALPSERYAADQLQLYLEKITGTRLPIVTDATRPGSHEILLGDNAH